MKWFQKKEKTQKIISPNSIRYRIHFYGLVQHVGFRIEVYKLALEFDVTGWIKNEEDGSVLCELQGTETAIQTILKNLQLIKRIQIDKIKKFTIEPVPESSFNIIG